MSNNQINQTKRLTVTAMFCAIAYLCMFVFRLKVGFLTFDAKDAVLAMISLLFGPWYGLVSAILVPLLEMITVSDTGVYGFIMNALSSVAFATVCGAVYQCRRNMAGAILGVSLAAAVTTGVMLLANLVITPYYMGVETTAVASMIPTLLLPFNLIKSILNAAIVLAIYKPFTAGLKRTGLLPQTGNGYSMSKRSVILLITSLLVVVLAVAAMLFLMHGEFEVFRQM